MRNAKAFIFHLLIGDRNAGRVRRAIQLGVDRQPVGRFGRGNQFDNNLMTDQRTTEPILRYELNSRCSILFHLLVPGGK